MTSRQAPGRGKRLFIFHEQRHPLPPACGARTVMSKSALRTPCQCPSKSSRGRVLWAGVPFHIQHSPGHGFRPQDKSAFKTYKHFVFSLVLNTQILSSCFVSYYPHICMQKHLANQRPIQIKKKKKHSEAEFFGYRRASAGRKQTLQGKSQAHTA